MKSSNLTRGLVVLIVVRRCPCGWPAWIAAFPYHEGMIAELHDSILDGNQAQSTEIESVRKLTITTRRTRADVTSAHHTSLTIFGIFGEE